MIKLNIFFVGVFCLILCSAELLNCPLATNLCDCGGGCPDTNGVCVCTSCGGGCTGCPSCECCKPPSVQPPNEWLELAKSGRFSFSSEYVSSHLFPNYGNGYLATQFGSAGLFISGVFNGEHVWSHRAFIPFPLNVNIKGPEILPGFAIAMDFENGTVLRYSRTQSNATILQRTYAHQQYQHLIITEFTINTLNSLNPFTLNFESKFEPQSNDITFISEKPNKNINCFSGKTKLAENINIEKISVSACWTSVPTETITIPPKQIKIFQFVASIWTSKDAKFTKSNDISHSLTEISQLENNLFETHCEAMKILWKPNIEIIGNLRLQSMVTSSFWNILLSLRPGHSQSLSPGGLPNNCYQGHVFWDTEQFIWPNLLLFHPWLAKECLAYRFDRRQSAAEKARLSGYGGLQFPWESAVSGEESSPAKSTGDYQIHISGDVALAVWQYFQTTHDLVWLRETGWPLLTGISEFYSQRADKRNGFYSLRNVMGVDEGHYPIEDSSYVNSVASIAIKNTIKAAKYLRAPLPDTSGNWSDIASGLRIPFDEKSQKYLDYYNMRPGSNGLGVILMSYPLNITMSNEIKENNLNYYSQQWPSANAMYWWAFSVLWNELENHQKADDYFSKITAKNVFGPFHIWSEDPGGHGCPNFITGAGAFLQSIWAGYGGIRISDSSLTFLNPRVPPGSTSLIFRQISYLTNKIDVTITNDMITFKLSQLQPLSVLDIYSEAKNSFYRLTEEPLHFELPDRISLINSFSKRASGAEL
eukprot:c19339_g1_i2.p1 GENE.c19339_g1_i2~~c19339_g1_i2.p1  ORF type:complete len:760 (+),score=265.46 c19339_g1_i2:36-2315(+)